MDIEAFIDEHQNLYLNQNGIRSQCSEDPGAAVRLLSKRQEVESGWEMLQRWWNERLYRCIEWSSMVK